MLVQSKAECLDISRESVWASSVKVFPSLTTFSNAISRPYVVTIMPCQIGSSRNRQQEILRLAAEHLNIYVNISEIYYQHNLSIIHSDQ